MKNETIEILVVDDEEKILTRVKKLLEKEGYLTDTASNGMDAIEKLGKKEYDILLTDINMPGKSGFELLDHVRGAGLDILPLVLTGYASVDSAIRAIKVGAYDFIQKPVDAETLKLSIHRAAERVLLKKENERNMKTLQRLNELKDEFITVVSHDLRSPLASIGGYANYLLKKGELNHTQRSYLLIMKEIADDLYALVNELLDISRIESGIIELNREETDISDLISASINNFILLAADKNTRIDFLKMLEDTKTNIDRVKFLQVINNLISNAVKFTENGHIEVRLSAPEDGSLLHVTVEDTGTGIVDEALQNIFDKYSYFRKEGTRGEGGMGLGLVICKRFVELHGGTITARNRSGGGSSFEITFPRGPVNEA